jgi:leucine dehydrogenase
MTTIRELSGQEHEHVFAFRDEASGLNGYLAIHNTRFGPAFGGIRIGPYRSDLAALTDALRLSRAMTFKVALAGLPCGGGKLVVMEHLGLRRRQAFEEVGKLVELCGGRFFTGPDVGVMAEDLQIVRAMTKYCSEECSPALGDIGEHTAIGVWHAMRACVEALGLQQPRVAIQGVGHVGMHLARILHCGGLDLIVCDIDRDRTRVAEREFGAKVVPPDDIFEAECDVFAPCALGAVINVHTVGKLRAGIVCGSANNVLASREDGDALHRRGILYAPDYLANAGGVIRGVEYYLESKPHSKVSLSRIYDRMKDVIEVAKQRNCSTAQIADERVEARLKASEVAPARA